MSNTSNAKIPAEPVIVPWWILAMIIGFVLAIFSLAVIFPPAQTEENARWTTMENELQSGLPTGTLVEYRSGLIMNVRVTMKGRGIDDGVKAITADGVIRNLSYTSSSSDVSPLNIVRIVRPDDAGYGELAVRFLQQPFQDPD